MVNKEEYEKIKQAVKYCALRGQYSKALSNINNYLRSPVLSDEEFIDEYVKHNYKSTSGIIYLVIGYVILAIIMSIFGSVIVDALEPGYGILFVMVIFAVVTFFAFIYPKEKAKEKVRKEAEAALVEYAADREKYMDSVPAEEAKQEEYTQKLKELLNTMKNRNLCVIPQKYWDVAPLLLSYIDNCRAHDLESAINVYENDLHNHRMEQRQARILAEQQQARIASEIAAENAESAKNAAGLSAALSLGSFIINWDNYKTLHK